jgi:hypothetical protein
MKNNVEFFVWCRRLEVGTDGFEFRLRLRCVRVLPGKSRTTEMPLPSSAQMCGASASFNRDENLTYPAMSMISPAQPFILDEEDGPFLVSQFSCKRGLPAAILPHKKINFAEVFIVHRDSRACELTTN